MTQELINLRTSILEGRYQDALVIVDELEGMSKQAILRNIQSFLLRLLIHLIKNQVEQRLTNSWAASIRDSIRQIKKLNLQDNKTAYYVKSDEWQPLLEEELDEAIYQASLEVMDGEYEDLELADLVNKDRVIIDAHKLLNLTYLYSVKELFSAVNKSLAELPGGKEWETSRSNKK
ncbi:hypothetical protein BCD67_20700 [Oscillatoriales cyanobacterium USR001]|nr:hypothetical protein BCD67_20700 [Oscillatoriales cyanobacterium USR001]